jgi:hypothetical protein
MDPSRHRRRREGVRPLCLLLGFALLVAACRGADGASVRPKPAAASQQTVLVVRGGRLAEIDAGTLEPLPGRAVHLRGQNGDVSLSPDGSRVAVGGAKSVRIVDLARLEVVAELPKPHGYSTLVSWAGRQRIVVVNEVFRRNRVDVLVLDVESGRLLSRAFAAEDGSSFAAQSANGAVALLLHPPRGIGPTRLVHTDRNGRTRLVHLDRIHSGVEYPRGFPNARFVWPALALDSDGAHAYVLGADDVVAAVDLEEESVEYHTLAPSLSLAARLRNWLEPSAEAKSADRTQVGALWLGDGRLAVYGYRTKATVDGEVYKALGLRLVDTSDWSVRMIDDEVVSLDRAGEMLLAWANLWDGGTGLRAYDLDGEQVFHVLGDRPIEAVSIVGARALVKLVGRQSMVAVDLADGRIARRSVEPAFVPARVVR